MTIDEAIKVLESEVECWRLHPEEAYPKALELGIEALKRLKYHRSLHSRPFYKLLPGETE